MNILIAVPTYETILPDTFRSIYDLDKGGHECAFDFIRGYDCAAARNTIARRALDAGTDYVLMVDADMVLPRDALVNLLEGGKDISLGYCAHRSTAGVYDGRTSIYRLGECSYTQAIPVLEFRALKENGQTKIQVHGGGMACALIRTEVFRMLQYPWFYWQNYASGDVLSEDLYFCEQCKNHGIPVYADARVGCGHLFRHVQWPV